jgi:hypothetical protein
MNKVKMMNFLINAESAENSQSPQMRKDTFYHVHNFNFRILENIRTNIRTLYSISLCVLCESLVFSALKKTESKVHKEDKTYGDCVIFLKPHFRLQSIKLLFYKLLFLIFLFPLLGKGQEKLYFSSKVDGEDIQYFSPYHEYAHYPLQKRK